MSRRTIQLLLSLFFIGLMSLACVGSEKAAFEKARDDYQECLSEFPGKPERCVHLRAEANAQYDAYEGAAKEVWNRDDDWRDREDPWQ